MPERAPAWFVKRVEEIDRRLSVEWLPREGFGEGRWGIMQHLENTPSIENTVDIVARDAQVRFAREGRIIPLETLAATVYAVVARDRIALLAQDDEGHAVPLDERLLARLREMAWNVRNKGLQDWLSEARAMRSALEQRREREVRDMWAYSSRDPVFKAIFSDLLAGLQPRIHFGGPKAEVPPAATQPAPAPPPAPEAAPSEVSP